MAQAWCERCPFAGCGGGWDLSVAADDSQRTAFSCARVADDPCRNLKVTKVRRRLRQVPNIALEIVWKWTQIRAQFCHPIATQISANGVRVWQMLAKCTRISYLKRLILACRGLT